MLGVVNLHDVRRNGRLKGIVVIREVRQGVLGTSSRSQHRGQARGSSSATGKDGESHFPLLLSCYQGSTNFYRFFFFLLSHPPEARFFFFFSLSFFLVSFFLFRVEEGGKTKRKKSMTKCSRVGSNVKVGCFPDEKLIDALTKVLEEADGVPKDIKVNFFFFPLPLPTSPFKFSRKLWDLLPLPILFISISPLNNDLPLPSDCGQDAHTWGA